MPVTLQENLRGLLYAPYYAALSLDAYRREGVTVGLVTAPSPAEAVAGLFNGTVDVAWGGPMRVMQTYDQRPDCDLVCFGEAVTRDPFLLIGRGGRGDKPDRNPFAAIGVKRQRCIVWRVEQTAQVFLESNRHETT